MPPDLQNRFLAAVAQLVTALAARRADPPAGLRVKGVQGHPRVFELTFAPDGRATFEYGPEQRPGEAHIVWRRIGDHSIFRAP
ncbi:MAG: hypothetical protein ACR2LY_04255 [Thermoleophilaceae bacterium]